MDEIASRRLPRLRRLFFVLALLPPLTAHAQAARTESAQEPSRSIDVGGQLDVTTRYVWRGIDYGGGGFPYATVYATAYHMTFTLGYFSSFSGSSGRGGRDGLDLTLSYKWDLGPWAIEPSLYYYHYLTAATSPPSGEVATKVSWRAGGVTLYTDQICDAYNFAGAYFGDIGATYSRSLSPRLSWKTTVWLGWANATFNEANIGVARTALNTLGLEASLTWNLTNAIYVRPHASYNYTIDPRLQEHTRTHVFNAGLAVGFAF